MCDSTRCDDCNKHSNILEPIKKGSHWYVCATCKYTREVKSVRALMLEADSGMMDCRKALELSGWDIEIARLLIEQLAENSSMTSFITKAPSDHLKSPVAYELEELFYSALCEKGKIDIDDLFEITDTKSEYGLRIVSSGAIIILRERYDVRQGSDRKGMCFELKKEKCVECGEDKPYRELLYGVEPVCTDCGNKR